MKKTTIYLLTLILFSGCVLQYDGETKLITKGRIVDENNQPIPNITVSIVNIIYSNPGAIIIPPIAGDYNVISSNKTNFNGEFLMVSPASTNENENSILIDQSNTFQAKMFDKILRKDFIDYTLDIGTVKLFKTLNIVDLNITLNLVNFQNRITRLKIIGNDASKVVSYNPFLNSENQFYTDYFVGQVAKNQTVLLEYDVLNLNSNLSVTLQQSIQINEDNVNYTLDY
ncbi:hypothetical protein [Flavobacterium sp.]|uniref:hypothetical protein n=1 Tax=Flavobacterium sp. TaxID=239 RepID=UPI003750DBC6